ncbi:hypothetical protein ADIS_4466 [Lunatimonas lonarensis]|uniref:Uncharacterized protein n=1 Tax=Lunatimonas lonarensis TaxID=1232681 RepID=R7ZLM8_9BACT|nr:hypothetical protein [Lunatimonas lonarensis]EON74977.1 hypothetical protein ADIS_4466 [Lunatimonas lonarensis]
MDLEAHYGFLDIQARNQVLEEGFGFDRLIDDPGDSRRGLTLLLRPGQELAESFGRFTDAVKQVVPGHHLYGPLDFHVTVIPIISCYSGFSLEGVSIGEYLPLIDASIQGIGRISIRFRGVFMSPSCLMIKGYPEDGELEKLRESLRRSFAGSSLEQSLDKRYKLVTAHSTVVRFKHAVENQEAVLEVLDRFSGYEFGVQAFHEVEFVFNDWYQRAGLVKLLASFPLLANPS